MIFINPVVLFCSIHVVFGQVLSGLDIVLKIEAQETNSENRPVKDVRISNCGELVLQVRPKMKGLSEKVFLYFFMP